MVKQASVVHSSIKPRDVRPLVTFDAADYEDLARIGINIPPHRLAEMMDGIGMDALQAPQTTPSIPTPVQFLQTWLPGFVRVLTAARKIDDLVGISTIGAWEDEEIIQGEMELTGTAVPYGDYTNIPLSSWNLNYQERTVVRFEEGMSVGKLEDARASRIKVNSAAEKRQAATESLEILRNSIGFFGYNNGSNLTYGFLNDPNLLAFTVFPNGATNSSPSWTTKTFQDIQKDIRLGMAQLRTQSGETVDPDKMQITLAIATAVRDYLNITTDQGISVSAWLKDAYPTVRIVSAPELDNAHASLNVMYFYAENVSAGSTDDGATFLQPVPVKFMVIGVEQRAKGYLEDYGNATAGVWCKRPFAVSRWYGN